MSKSKARSEAMKRRWKQNREKMEEQRRRAVNAPGRIDKKKLSEKAKKQWKDPEFRKKTTEAVSDSNRRRWATDRDKELKNVSKGGLNVTPARSEGLKKSWEHPSQAQLANTERLRTCPHRRQRLSEVTKAKWERGEYKDSAKYKGHRYKGLWFRSSYELRYATWLDQQGYTWEYEPRHFKGPHPDRPEETLTYVPDFWVDELSSFVEIKAKWAVKANHRDCTAKCRLVEADGHKIFIVTEDTLADLQA